jgi:O-Antigen ligase
VTFFASLVLVLVLVIRPQEIWPALGVLHLLDVFTALVVVGLVVDIALGRAKPLYSPQLPFVGLFVLSCYFISALNLGVGKGLELGTNRALIPSIFMIAVMYGARSIGRLKGVMWLLLFLGAFVSAVAVHQGNQTPQCLERVTNEDGEQAPDLDTADGRECGMANDCRDGVRFDVEWACERIGLFKTLSTGRRVRWRGQLDDPNELSVFIGAIVPLLFALGFPGRRKDEAGPGGRTILGTAAIAVLGLGIYAVILSQSRGGQLVLATVFGIYFVSRYRAKGFVLAVVCALPVVLLGGRDAAEADESASERIELLYEGMSLFFRQPFRGVGVDQFADRVDSPIHLTAHNSYLLTATEVGFFGFVFWSLILWTSFKIPLTVLRRRAAEEALPELRSLAMALVVSLAGIAVGIFFLSFTYKQLLFVWFGLAGAMYRVVKQADSSFDIRIGWKDVAAVIAGDATILGLLYVYTRLKAGGA